MKTKNSTISRPMILMFGLIATIMTTQHGYAQGASHTCSVATLKGRYQFAVSGFVLMNGAYVPLAGAGIDILDGQGHLSSNSTLIVNGVVIFKNLIFPNGTYTVNRDC